MDKLVPSSGFDTNAVHAGQNVNKWDITPCVPPIFMSVSFELKDPDFLSNKPDFFYTRVSNPTGKCLEECIAALENSKYACVFPSGMAAIEAVLQILKSGDHLITLNNGYGGTYEYLTKRAIPSGIDVTFVYCNDIPDVKSALKSSTKMVWLETITNPTMKVIDIESISKMVHEFNQDILVAADNTFLSPCLQRSLDFGVDIVVHSVTKYMNGHSDVMMGATAYNQSVLDERFRSHIHLTGCCPSPFDCFLVNRSLTTLELRMQKHMSNGLAVARFLETHPMVLSVNHPGLPSHPQHDLANKLMKGYPGILSFYLKGNFEDCRKVLLGLKIFTLAFSVGSHKSYASLPWTMTHASCPADDKKKVGITENLVRLSIGLEDPKDLTDDLNQSLSALS